MSDFKVLSYEYLEANKDSNCYEFKKNPNYKGPVLYEQHEPKYIGKFISRRTGGDDMNYYFIYRFEKNSLYTGGENPTLNEYVLREVDEDKGRGKKTRRTRKNKKSRKSKRSKRTNRRR
jgi:hypothetical protein